MWTIRPSKRGSRTFSPTRAWFKRRQRLAMKSSLKVCDIDEPRCAAQHVANSDARDARVDLRRLAFVVRVEQGRADDRPRRQAHGLEARREAAR